jgi:hypothetical protein
MNEGQGGSRGLQVPRLWTKSWGFSRDSSLPPPQVLIPCTRCMETGQMRSGQLTQGLGRDALEGTGLLEGVHASFSKSGV